MLPARFPNDRLRNAQAMAKGAADNIMKKAGLDEEGRFFIRKRGAEHPNDYVICVVCVPYFFRIRTRQHTAPSTQHPHPHPASTPRRRRCGGTVARAVVQAASFSSAGSGRGVDNRRQWCAPIIRTQVPRAHHVCVCVRAPSFHVRVGGGWGCGVAVPVQIQGQVDAPPDHQGRRRVLPRQQEEDPRQERPPGNPPKHLTHTPHSFFYIPL